MAAAVSIVGRIVFEATDGTPMATVTYTQHPALRAPEIRFRGIWYRQNRKTDEGQWVYRAVGSVPGSLGTDPKVIED